MAKNAAFYQLSSHAGNEFVEWNPTFQRIKSSRNAILIGIAYFVTSDVRLYAETDDGVGTDAVRIHCGFSSDPEPGTTSESTNSAEKGNGNF